MTEQDEDRSSQAFPSQGLQRSCVGWSSWESSSAAFPVPPILSTHKNQTRGNLPQPYTTSITSFGLLEYSVKPVTNF